MNNLISTQSHYLSSQTCIAHFEDDALLRGMRDAFQIKLNRNKLGKYVPLRFACAVLRLCRMAGMTKTQFGLLINGEGDNGRAWQRYYTKRKPGQTWGDAFTNSKGTRFKTYRFRLFVLEARKQGWLDRRIKPTLPHPIDTGWGATSDEAVRQWTACELPLISEKILERLDAIDACVKLVQQAKLVNLETVRHETYVGHALKKKNFRDLAGHGQRARRAREKLAKNGKDINTYWHTAAD